MIPAQPNHSHRHRRLPSLQAGFTLLELLFAMAIVLVVVVSVQRYVAGVLTDREHLSAQQDQTNQINIVLSNLRNDVAHAGFIPVASADVPTDSTNKVGVLLRPCAGNNCVGNEVWLAYWTRESPAYDCLHNAVVTSRTSGWVRVENVYQFRGDNLSAPQVLGCNGNGGKKGGYWEGLTNDVAGDIQDFNWTLDSGGDGAKLLHLCMNTRTEKNNQVGGRALPKSCTTGETLSKDGALIYQTIQLDMLVRASQVGGAP